MNILIDMDLKIGDFVLNKKTGEVGKIFDFDPTSDTAFVYVGDFNFELWKIKSLSKSLDNV